MTAYLRDMAGCCCPHTPARLQEVSALAPHAALRASCS
jgi:hypothetical protein